MKKTDQSSVQVIIIVTIIIAALVAGCANFEEDRFESSEEVNSTPSVNIISTMEPLQNSTPTINNTPTTTPEEDYGIIEFTEKEINEKFNLFLNKEGKFSEKELRNVFVYDGPINGSEGETWATKEFGLGLLIVGDEGASCLVEGVLLSYKQVNEDSIVLFCGFEDLSKNRYITGIRLALDRIFDDDNPVPFILTTYKGNNILSDFGETFLLKNKEEIFGILNELLDKPVLFDLQARAVDFSKDTWAKENEEYFEERNKEVELTLNFIDDLFVTENSKRTMTIFFTSVSNYEKTIIQKFTEYSQLDTIDLKRLFFITNLYTRSINLE